MHCSSSRRLSAPLLSLVLLGVGALCSTPAQASETAAAAEHLFREGQRLMQEEDYAAACPKLADSHKLDPGVGTLLNLALCYRKAGKTASAWSTYQEAAALARKEGQDG